MSDARKQAEEALARYDALCEPCPPGCNCMRCHVRALLAEQGAGGANACPVCRGPIARHRHRGPCSCRDCCNQPLPFAPLAPPPAPEAHETIATVTVPAGVAGPDDPIRVRFTLSDAAVREAAEAVAREWDVTRSTFTIQIPVVLARALDALLSALSSPAAPAKDEVREAAKRLSAEWSKNAHRRIARSLGDACVCLPCETARFLSALAARGGA